MNIASPMLALLLMASTLGANAQPAAQAAEQRPCESASPDMHRAHGCRNAGPGQYANTGEKYTPGWSLMTSKERQAHRERMRSFKSYEECKAYLAHHHQEMVSRAKEKGLPMPAVPRHDACAPLERAGSK